MSNIATDRTRTAIPIYFTHTFTVKEFNLSQTIQYSKQGG